MRICIDGTPLLLPSGGVKNYIYYWLLHLSRLSGDDSIQIFPFLTGPSHLNHEDSNFGPWQSAVRLAFVNLANIRGNRMLDWMGGRYDLFHASNTHVRNPPSTSILTSTLYDMSCWLVPETHAKANVAATKEFFHSIAKRARGFIAISESTRRDAIRILGLSPEAVEVIYPGVADAFFDADSRAIGRVRDRYGVAKPYILYVGTIEPRKNVDTLLDAYAALTADARARFDLIIAGSIGWASQATIGRLESPPEGVRRLGYVAEEDLPGLTAGAHVLAYPSLYEGFGLPVAQAMAAGVPVVTSNVSSLPEVAGNAGLQVDPRSAAEVSAALERILGSTELREELSINARAKAGEYRWDYCARKSLDFFHRAAGK